jgi:hypothetical protein
MTNYLINYFPNGKAYIGCSQNVICNPRQYQDNEACGITYDGYIYSREFDSNLLTYGTPQVLITQYFEAYDGGTIGDFSFDYPNYNFPYVFFDEKILTAEVDGNKMKLNFSLIKNPNYCGSREPGGSVFLGPNGNVVFYVAIPDRDCN